MKKNVCSLIIFCAVYAFITLVQAAGFLPKANGKEFGIKYGETIAREFVKAPKIDGNLDDWQGAVWIAFDTEKELLRGKETWGGKDDISMTWSVAYDNDNFYFATAVRDDIFSPGPDDGNVWKGDCIFLYIDWENKKTGAPDCKPNLSFMNKEAKVLNFGKHPEVTKSKIAVEPNANLGKGGMIYEVAMPFKYITTVKVAKGLEVGMTPGYEEGFNNKQEEGVFLDWGGINPDKSELLGRMKFGGPIVPSSVEASNKLTTFWGVVKGE